MGGGGGVRTPGKQRQKLPGRAACAPARCGRVCACGVGWGGCACVCALQGDGGGGWAGLSGGQGPHVMGVMWRSTPAATSSSYSSRRAATTCSTIWPGVRLPCRPMRPARRRRGGQGGREAQRGGEREADGSWAKAWAERARLGQGGQAWPGRMQGQQGLRGSGTGNGAQTQGLHKGRLTGEAELAVHRTAAAGEGASNPGRQQLAYAGVPVGGRVPLKRPGVMLPVLRACSHLAWVYRHSSQQGPASIEQPAAITLPARLPACLLAPCLPARRSPPTRLARIRRG